MVTVTVIAALVVPCVVAGNVRLVGETDTVVCGTSVVPLSGTLCGLFIALSVITKVPLLGLVPVGVNVTAIVQVMPAGSGSASVEQVPPETANGLSPVVMLEKEIVPPPVLVFFTVTVIGELVVFCKVAGNVKLPGVICTAICGTSVVPLKGTSCGLLAALSAIVKVPLLGAVPAGVNVTAIVQLAPAASGELSVEQVPPDTANEPSPVEIFEKVMVCDAVLVFFTVTDIGELAVLCSVAGNVSDAGVTVTVGCPAVVPCSATSCGLPEVALSASVKVPVLAAVPVGVNVMRIVQVDPAAIGEASVEQVPPEIANGPLMVMLENVSVSEPVLVFFTVTVIGALVVFCACAGNVTLAGVTITVVTCAVVVPLSVTVCGLPVALSLIESVPVLGAVPVGVNVTKIVQLAFCAIPLPVVEQVPPETANGPVVAMIEKVTLTAVALVFFTVTVMGALVVFRFCAGKVSVGGVTVTVAVAVAVVPLSVTVCGLPVALSSNTSVPLLGAVPVGVNVTNTVQELPGEMPVPPSVQVPPAATAKGPVVAKLDRTAFATLLTLLVSVTVTGPLVVFCGVAGKDTLEGRRIVRGVTPVPDKLTVCTVPGPFASLVTVRVPCTGPTAVGANEMLKLQL